MNLQKWNAPVITLVFASGLRPFYQLDFPQRIGFSVWLLSVNGPAPDSLPSTFSGKDMRCEDQFDEDPPSPGSQSFHRLHERGYLQ